MPNLLAHIGVQAPLVRTLYRDLDPRWILAGCLLPDLPWILQRIVRAAVRDVDPYELRLYVIAQASLFGTLFLCIALAACARRFVPVVVVLAGSAALHLLLDSLQTKWGNGVHLLAPLSWRPANFGLFWPESPVTYLMVVFGCVCLIREWPRLRFTRREHPRLQRRKLAVSAASLAGYFLLPFVFVGAVEESNSHSVKTLREVDSRPGRQVAFDRDACLVVDDQVTIRTFAGEWIEMRGLVPARSGIVSARGVFTTPSIIHVGQLHEHLPGLRDLASYAGLVAVAWYFAFPLWGRRHERRAREKETRDV